MKGILAALTGLLLLSGCATSHVLVGTQRPPVPVESVRVYLDPPAQFEKVAILESSSEGSFAFTSQQKTNKVVSRLKAEAASLGANGILLQGVGNATRGAVINSFGTAHGYASGNSYNAYGSGMAIAAPIVVKEGAALAIYVPDTVAASQLQVQPLQQGPPPTQAQPQAPQPPAAATQGCASCNNLGF